MAQAADIGGEPHGPLRAAKLRELTGLSDRQLHEWDKRGALPHDRPKGGHRRVNTWEAMALKILAAIRDRYQIPLTKLLPLLEWAIGNSPSKVDRLRAFFPANLVVGSQAEADFASQLRSLALQSPSGVSILNDLPELIARAKAIGNPGLTSAVHRLAGGLAPLYRVLGEMSIGFPVFLITNLDRHIFGGEPLLIDYVRAGALPKDSLVIRVDEHINAVLQAAGVQTLPIRHRAAEIREVEGEALEEGERIVLDLLRQRDFERITILPKDHAFRIEITRELAASEAAEIGELIRSHEYQSVLVKMRHGEMTRLSQTVSILAPNSADGKTPHRAGPKGSYDA